MNRYSAAEIFAMGKTVITAHSACEGTLPNSREHVLAAIASGAEMIEVDVRMDDNGALYMSHDLPEDTSACMKLCEMFALIAPETKMGMNLDVKTEGLIEAVMKLAAEYGLTHRIVFTGACNSERAKINTLGGEMWRSMWPGDSIPEGIAANKVDGSPYLNVHYGMITDEYDAALRAIGGGFSAWTVDKEEEIVRFLKMGVSNITTRKPVLAMRLRKEIQGI